MSDNVVVDGRSKVVCYPLKRGGSKHANFELRHSLRSLEKHWKGGGRVVLLGSSKPKWLSDKVEFIRANGYMEAMKKGSKLADDILWMNDDIYFLKDTDWDDVRVWKRGPAIGKRQEKELLESKNGWRRRLGVTVRELRKRGLDTFKYSSHTPYFYEADKMVECIKEFDSGYKTPIETAYGNYWKVPMVYLDDEKLRRYGSGAIGFDDLDGKRYFNHSDSGFTAHVRGFLRGLFPYRSKYEVARKGKE